MRAGSNPDAAKLVTHEMAHIKHISSGLAKEYATARETIGALLALLALRQRYFALVGEHFSVFDFDGITAMDQLDEHLLGAAHEILTRRPKADPDEDSEKALGDALANVPSLPQHPVGYMVLFQIRRVFEAFDAFIQDERLQGDENAMATHEHAFLRRVASAVETYVTGRRTPIARHFSDMAREYSVVSRLHCPCGQSKYEVKMQSLITDTSGERLDRLDVKCSACGQTTALEFPLPYFGDLSIA